MELSRLLLWICAVLLLAGDASGQTSPSPSPLPSPSPTPTNYSVVAICDNTQPAMVQCAPGIVDVLFAWYGRTLDSQCNAWGNKQVCGLDILDKAQVLCQSKHNCTVSTSAFTGLDNVTTLCKNVPVMELRMHYQCVPPVKCDGMPAETTAQLAHSSGFPQNCSDLAIGLTCNATCLTGYRGNYTSLCKADGTGAWSPATGSCTQITCPGSPTLVPNTIAWPSNCSGFVFNTTCQTQCSLGWTGTYTSICSGSGWSTPQGSCTQVTCSGAPTRTAPANSTGWPEDCSGQKYGSNCTAKCLEGYVGSLSSTCGNGTWSASTGSCTPITCSGVPTSSAPANSVGWPSTCSGQAYGSVCTAMCSAGFTGSINSTCRSNGTWTAATGACTQITCSGAPTTAPANSAGWPVTCSGQAYGSVCTAKCLEGYAGSFNSTCSVTGSWSAATGACTQVTCAGAPTASPPANSLGWASTCAGKAYGAICTAACAEGFSGSLSSTCGSTGSWSAATGSCTMITCEGQPTADPPANSAGWAATCAGQAFGTPCTAQCADGFKGSLTSKCTATGWSAAEGSCDQITCPGTPGTEAPAGSTGWPETCAGMAYGSMCAASCSEGFFGNASSSCTAEGWSTPGGTCTQVTCSGTPSSQAVNSQTWPETCSGQEYGSVCEAPCIEGFKGKFTSKCTAEGWARPQGGCDQVTCDLPPPQPANTVFPASCAGMAANAVCHGQCGTGYTGSLASTCGTTGTWLPVEGDCSQITCSATPTLTPITNTTGWPDACLQQPAGYKCVSPCAAGYVGVNYTSTCTLEGTWSQPTGTCYQPFCPGMPVATPPSTGTGWPSSCTNTLAGGVCKQSCIAGYSGAFYTKCFANATLSWSTTYRGNCIRDTCPSIPAVTLNDTTGWPGSCAGAFINDTCTAPCAQSYHGPGYTMTCASKNTWGQVTGTCIRDRCSSMPTDATPNSQGWPDSCLNITSGSSCKAPCDSAFGTGYTIQCAEQDKWAAATGTCPETCSGPPTADAPTDSRGWGASCANGNVVGFKCVAACAPNFKGRYVSQCLGKNQWGEVSGSCEPLCKEVHKACATCRSVRIPGTDNSTELQCSTCFPGWRLRRDGLSKTCDCSAGFMMNGTVDSDSSWCMPCAKGMYCPGGNAKDNPESKAYNCTPGLATISEGARSEQQCYTLPGYGRVTTVDENTGKVITEVFVCPTGTYNVGGNTVGCTKCFAGLTTVATGSTNSSACVAPPGSYADVGTGARACPKGTYTTDYNNLPACIPCPDGITTARDNSTSPTQCKMAKKGYYLVNTTYAEQCAPGSYQGVEAEVYKCEDCPYGWQTRVEGAGGTAECMAPPGFERQEGAEWITECKIGFYKEGWNKNPCIPCGNGLTTAKNGSVTKDQCIIPVGWGIVTLEPLVAVMCANGSYGINTTRAVASNARCVPCPPNLFTNDTLSGVPATAPYLSELDCLLKPGWGMSASGEVKICQPGTYNPGLNRKPCQECGTGFTSLEAGGEDEDVCVVQSGWAMDTKYNIPKPCDIGTYSTGGTIGQPNGACLPCPDGLTTQKDEADSVEDCDVCAPGRGGLNCTLCPYNTYSTGVHKKDEDCLPCAEHTVSARGSIHNTECIAELVDCDKDYFPLSDDTKWVDHDANTAIECQFSCNNDTMCAMFRFSTDVHARKCQLLLESPDGGQAIALKADNSGSAYAIYKVDAGLKVGTFVSDEGTKTPEECMKACSAANHCELASMDAAALLGSAGPCQLYGSELDPDWMGMYHIQGRRLYADMLRSASSDGQ